jgi:SAM-dependent methyltransferase
MTIARRLSFGEVAELYDRHRPSYPWALVDDLIHLAGVGDGARVVEVGAGTGKATALFAARGLRVVAIEPSSPMAALARRNCASHPAVEVLETDFEGWDAGGETFGLVYAAQAWHWIDPAVAFRRARAVLRRGGVLGVFWNRPAWEASGLRDALVTAYRTTVPDLPQDGPMHPANPSPEGDPDWSAEIAAAGGFEAPEVRRYPWSLRYDSDQYAGLLETMSDVQMLDEPHRRALLAAVHAAIEDHGGTLSMPMFTRLCLARAA